MGINVFDAPEIDFDNKLIPAGRIVLVTIETDGEVKSGRNNPDNKYLDWKLTVKEGPYAGAQFYENVGTAGGDNFVTLGRSKLKAVLEVGKVARKPEDYEINSYKMFNGMQALVVVKVEVGVNRDGKAFHKNTVARYGSSNPASSRFHVFEAYSRGEQPFQTDELPPLPVARSGSVPSNGGHAMQDVPLSAYSDL
jgi:hypothetical protein